MAESSIYASTSQTSHRIREGSGKCIVLFMPASATSKAKRWRAQHSTLSVIATGHWLACRYGHVAACHRR